MLSHLGISTALPFIISVVIKRLPRKLGGSTFCNRNRNKNQLLSIKINSSKENNQYFYHILLSADRVFQIKKKKKKI